MRPPSASLQAPAPRTFALAALAVLLLLGVPGVAAEAAGPATRPPGPWIAPTGPGPFEVVRGFAPGPHPWSPGHRGVDLRLGVGAPVVAAGPGVVTFAGPLAGRGVVVVGHDGGLRTTYEPVTARVAVGDRVATGDVLGELAVAGGHCVVAAGRGCLHWGLRRGTGYLDPLALLRPSRVRLLPHLGDADAYRSRAVVGPSSAQVAAPVAAQRERPAGEHPADRSPTTAATWAAIGTAAAVAGSALSRRRRRSR